MTLESFTYELVQLMIKYDKTPADIPTSITEPVRERISWDWNKKAKNLLYSNEKTFHEELAKELPVTEMPFKDTYFELKVMKLLDRSKLEFRHQIADFPNGDEIYKMFSDTIQSIITSLRNINTKSLNSVKNEYYHTVNQLIAEYVVNLNAALRGEPELFVTITTKHNDDIMIKYDQKTARYPVFIIDDNRPLFQYKVSSKCRCCLFVRLMLE